jgi:O-antigen/teichoic acid export membrane protein
MFVLTRWIGPHAYGLFVTALGLTAFLTMVTRAGVDTYLVRVEAPPDDRTYSIAATLIMGLSIVLVGVGAAAVPLLTRWYGDREFLPAYLVTMITIPLAGLAGVPTAKLERDLNFRAVAGIELAGQMLALLVSVALAWRGFGIWAPVSGLIAWQFWAACGALKAAKLNLYPAFDAVQARRMLSFGIGYTASLRVWQLRTLVNPLVVGRFAGAEAVAFVALAIRISEGLGFVRIAAGRLAIAALSRLRQDRQQFRLTLESALQFQLLALGPLLCLFALAAPVVIPRMLGVRWNASLQVYPFVAAGVLVNSLYNLQASALFVLGQQWMVLRAHALHVALLGFATLLLLPRVGIVAYGCAELAACGGYAVLHAGAKDFTRVSYRSLAWLGIAFLAPLFGVFVRKEWIVVLWLPLGIVAAVKLWNRAQNRHLRGPAVHPVPSLQSELSDPGA